MNAERLIVTNASVAGVNSLLENFTLVCENDRITDLFPSAVPTAGGNVIDAKGAYLVPGFIDLHIHGLRGKCADNGPGDLNVICNELPGFGVTAFLPALTPSENECRILSDLASVKTAGTEVLGFFLEGHFLKLTGAIRSMIPVHTAARVKALQKAAAGKKLIFGISPEIPGILDLLPLMCEDNTAFITHTMAGYEETEKAIQAGARHATHFYDVFPYPGEQEPGVRGCGAVEAVMSDREVTVDFILDGEHVHPGAVKMALACKGPSKVCLVTDANINAGLDPGIYRGINNVEIEMKYRGGPAREYNSSSKESEADRKPGGLTGSGLTMDLAFKNAVNMLGLSVPAAAALCSANPAKVLGLDRERGIIEKGLRADFSLFDKDLNIMASYISGKCVFSA